MQILGNKRTISATDLNDRLACRHLFYLNLERALGRLEDNPGKSTTGELLARKGDEHEDDYLKYLEREGLEVVRLDRPESSREESLRDAASATVDAMREGPDVIFQATFYDGEARGHTDFLFRVDRPSDLGDYSYEVADTKLARRSKPYFIIQLCFYSELLEKVQGGGPPESIHVILGNREHQTFRLSDFSAYYRQLRETFQADLDAGVPDSDPYPVAHCDICSWNDRCTEHWESVDHLSRVANIQRRQVNLLEAAGVDTLTSLSELEPTVPPAGIRPETLAKLKSQAELQVASTPDDPKLKLLPPRDDRGLARLPKPSEGDIFFDFEGDPLYGDQGLEYLFGYVTTDSEQPAFEFIWAGDPTAENLAFEQFIDWVTDRRKAFPDLHIYHYAPYEVTALKRLAATYATRENELDDLLRAKVFVDLFKVVRESMQIGQPSYSIKNVEAYYRPGKDGRNTAVADGGDSIVQFEKWLQTKDESIKEAILEYNEDDCHSTLECRDWLIERRADLAAEFGVEPEWFDSEHDPDEAGRNKFEANSHLREGLTKNLPEEAVDRNSEEQARWLLARLVDYHQREARPAWWEFFDRLDFSDEEEFIDDPEAIGGISPEPVLPPRPDKQSMVHTLRFVAQETKLGPCSVTDPVTGESGGAIVGISLNDGTLELRRGPKLSGTPLPRSVFSGMPYGTDPQKEALQRLAEDVITHEEIRAEFAASRDILACRPPRIQGLTEGERIVDDSKDLEELAGQVGRMDNTCLFIQGPPGAGKTFSGSHLITDMINAGHKVGVTATSHKAIHNLLHEVEEDAAEKGLNFRGLKKGGGEHAFVSTLDTPFIHSTKSNSEMEAPDVALTAGTAWYFCRDDVEKVDYLFVDEAGQISLADAIALGTGARNIVLLGDPQQLPQVSRGRHPDGTGLSVLEHLLGPHQTVPSDRGVFLSDTWRLHPDVTEFVSELMYENRLHSAPGRECQTVRSNGEFSGTGLRWVPMKHSDRSQRAPEEAQRVAEIVCGLTDGSATYVDFNGDEHPLTLEDILIVSPYNTQVRCLVEHLPEGAKVGTVDKFQGQEAQVVIFSMATSSGDEIPRNIDFLFSRNRLNVAISRARCLAILVANSKLLEVEAKSVQQMRLINALCHFVEVSPPPDRHN